MKVLKKTQADKFANSSTCSGVEYSFNEKLLNIAVITIDGRYPSRGHLTNEVINEIIYVIDGTGTIGVGDKVNKLSPGDAVFIKSGERYFLEGKMQIFVPCTPAFYPEQHKEVA